MPGYVHFKEDTPAVVTVDLDRRIAYWFTDLGEVHYWLTVTGRYDAQAHAAIANEGGQGRGRNTDPSDTQGVTVPYVQVPNNALHIWASWIAGEYNPGGFLASTLPLL